MADDVIVVGAGPGGSAAAAFLARAGIKVRILDRADFPRDKVCGDGLTPQAIYWLDRLGCADEVLAETNACISDCDLFINGRHLLRGGFPKDTIYPDFAILLDRRRFDNILLQNAIKHGAQFLSGHVVRGLQQERDAVRVVCDTQGGSKVYEAQIVIGADGVASAVSRAIGNSLKAGVMALSLRAYYRDVKSDGAQISVYFDRDYFPGYGWIFVDDGGFANVGLGYAVDRRFPPPGKLRDDFHRFLERELGGQLGKATRCGPVSGGAAAFYRPKSIVADRVMLVGDAANQTDPLNGGGIHKAMESAYFAAEAAIAAFKAGNFLEATLGCYERRWTTNFGLDWQTAELFLTIAKNPHLRDFCLFLLTQIGHLTVADRRFQDFCSGVFSGVICQSVCLSPRALYDAFPKDPRVWQALLDSQGGTALGAVRMMRGALEGMAFAGKEMVQRPLTSIDWGIEVATKTVELVAKGLGAAPSASGAATYS